MKRCIRNVRIAVAALIAVVLTTGCADTPEALVASAKANLAKDDRAAAVIQLRNALQKNPDLGEARFLLGQSLLYNGDLQGAERELRKALELNYAADDVIPELARLHMQRGDYQKAIDEFGKATITGPRQRADLQTTIGEARTVTGDLKGARAAFAAAREAQPDYAPAAVGEARLVAAGGDLPGALALLDGTLAKAPALADGWLLKGDILVAQGQVDEAIVAFRKSLDAKPKQLVAHYRIVTLLMQQGKTDEAAKQLAAMKEVAPKHPQTLYLQALLAFRQRDYAAARDAVQLHLRATPGNLPGLMLGAQIDYQLANYAQAAAALTTVLQRSPKQTFARRMLVQAYLREGRPAKALEALQPLLQGAQPDSNTLALAGEVYARYGDTTAASRYFEQALAMDPKNPEKRTAAALSRMVKGESERGLSELEMAAAEDTGIRADLALVAANLQQRKYDAALAAVDAIEKKEPPNALSHNLRGTVLLAKRDVAGARRSFESSIAMDPTYFPAVLSLARLDVLEKKPDDAKKRFDAILAKDPKDVRALLALAALRAQTGGSSDEVAALIAKAIEGNPSDSTARLTLISHYMRSKEPKKAVAAAQDAVAALPDRPEILDAAGRAYRYAGDSNQAIATYNRLAQLRTDSPIPFLHIAEIQITNKELAAARESVLKALAIKSDSVEAQRMMVALDINAGKGPAALAVARDVQKQRPDESIGYVLEGDIRMRERAFSQAAAAYRNGLKKAESVDLAIRLHIALDASGNSSEAGKFAAEWLKDHKTDIKFRHYIGEQSIGRKDYATATKQYSAILELEPNDAMALNNLAWLVSQQNDPKALAYAERAYALAPGNPAILDTFGMLLVEKGDTARGIELMQKAVEIAPNAPTIRLNLARALIKGGQKDAAKKELATLAKLGDKFAGQAEIAKLMQAL